MKLSDFLSVLITNNITVVVKDLTTATELISLKASGYENLDDTLKDRTVAQWQIVGATSITVILNSATSDETPAEEPSNEVI